MSPTLKKLLRFPSRPKAATDEQLVERIKNGDQDAWALFLERYTDVLYNKARKYSHSTWAQLDETAREDEIAELYLFMAQRLQRSLLSFKGDCTPSTWVHAVCGHQAAVIKGYLRQQDSRRSDTRLPRFMADRPALDQETFDGAQQRRLIAAGEGQSEGRDHHAQRVVGL